MTKGIGFQEKIELDSKDKAIISALNEDGRYTIAQISNKTGIQRDSVMYRLKNLIKNKVITGFNPILNPPALGYSNLSMILVKVKITTEDEKREFQEGLIKNKFVIHIAKLIGKYDYNITVVYKDTAQFYNILEEIKNVIPNFISEIEHLQVVEEPKYDDLRGLL